MKDSIATFFILSTFVIFMYAAVMQGVAQGKESLKFSTDKVRAMWHMCSTQFKKVAPHIGQVERVRLCDCYVDHMRSTFTPEQVIALTSEESRKLGMKMKFICPTKPPITIEEST